MKHWPFVRPPLEHGGVLGLGLVLPLVGLAEIGGLLRVNQPLGHGIENFAALLWWDELELSEEAVLHVAQKESGALLAVVFDEDPTGTRRGDFADFVSSDGNPADGRENFDLLHLPANGGLPQDGVEDRACGGRRDDIVADALDLHFRPREAGDTAR